MKRCRLLTASAFFVFLAGCTTTYQFAPGGPKYEKMEAQEVYREILSKQAASEKMDRPLRLLNAPMPDFPAEAQSARMTGQVVMRFTVQPDGSVANLRVISGSNQVFVRATQLALQQWHFEPIEKDGKVVTLDFVLPFDFKH